MISGYFLHIFREQQQNTTSQGPQWGALSEPLSPGVSALQKVAELQGLRQLLNLPAEQPSLLILTNKTIAR